MLDLLGRAEERLDERVDDPGLHELAHAHCRERLQDEGPDLRHVLWTRSSISPDLTSLVLELALDCQSGAVLLEEQGHQALDELDRRLGWGQPDALVRLPGDWEAQGLGNFQGHQVFLVMFTRFVHLASLQAQFGLLRGRSFIRILLKQGFELHQRFCVSNVAVQEE